ncbi:spore germination protein [Halobacillus mangrovi]|uniref:spore germination protein n=1 Tax=Halobacillus mangrovi TaxID=402384 RepID=UPI003D974575
MPCIIFGKIQINNVSGGVINFGDSLYIAPENVTISETNGDGTPVVDTGVGQAVTDPNIT